MRTKTIVLLAALGVASAVTASAQVYSVNVVGYVNVTVKSGFNLIANPLDNKNTGDNTVANVLAGVPDGTTLYKFGASGYEVASYEGEWDPADMTVAPGEGFWLELPAGATDQTITFVGDVKQGNLCTPLRAGFTLVSSQVPQAGALQGVLGYAPDDGDAIYTWNATTDAYTIYSYEGEWDPNDPVIGVGEGFWVEKLAAKDWCRNFSVNP